MDSTNSYFVHNGYCGWSYGTPGDPQLIAEEDAQELMHRSNLSMEQISANFPPAQFAEPDSPLFVLLGGNRFLAFSNIQKCGDRHQRKINTPLHIDWSKLS